ncbi:MAG: DUF4417 domain-containing protein [Alistipes sp.]|nr:DUF4417 domain-containing protein [Alistipes sp.]
MEIQQIKTKRLLPNEGQIEGLPTNPRQIKKKAFDSLKKSIKDAPEMLHLRELIVYPYGDDFVVIGGNMRLRACRELGFEELPCKVLPAETPAEKLREYAIKDNVEAGEDDWDVLANDWNAEELTEWGMITPDDWKIKEEKQEEDEMLPPAPDLLFPTNNQYDIPTLLPDLQAANVELPIIPWGANSRRRTKAKTVHFYIEDYRFEAVWKHPEQVLATGCNAIVEPNYSLHDQTPIAYGLNLIYKKRWLARWWQDCGVAIYVDLFVAPKFKEFNLLGVPKGWNAFFTRGESYIDGRLQADFETAQQISGKDHPNIVVYGGGNNIKSLCEKKNILFIEDFMTAKL